MADLAEKIAGALHGDFAGEPIDHSDPEEEVTFRNCVASIRRVLKEQETVEIRCFLKPIGEVFPDYEEHRLSHGLNCPGPTHRLIDGGPDA